MYLEGRSLIFPIGFSVLWGLLCVSFVWSLCHDGARVGWPCQGRGSFFVAWPGERWRCFSLRRTALPPPRRTGRGAVRKLDIFDRQRHAIQIRLGSGNLSSAALPTPRTVVQEMILQIGRSGMVSSCSPCTCVLSTLSTVDPRNSMLRGGLEERL